MRKANLMRSIARFLEPEASVVEAAYMWRRHRLVVPYATVSFLGMMAVASWAGANDWPTRVVIGLAGVAVAVAASTDYRIVAHTSHGTLLLDASRIRQMAIGKPESISPGAKIQRVGGNVLATEWDIAGSVYTVPRSSERAMSRIAGLP